MYGEHGLGKFIKEIGAQHSHSYYMFLTGIKKEVIRKLDKGWNPPGSE